jgi:hypothetical protein
VVGTSFPSAGPHVGPQAWPGPTKHLARRAGWQTSRQPSPALLSSSGRTSIRLAERRTSRISPWTETMGPACHPDRSTHRWSPDGGRSRSGNRRSGDAHPAAACWRGSLAAGSVFGNHHSAVGGVRFLTLDRLYHGAGEASGLPLSITNVSSTLSPAAVQAS